MLIREGVDLVIEFQTDEAVAPAIASRYLRGGHPDDRHRHPASGRHLLRREQLRGGPAGRPPPRPMGEQRWDGQVDEMLLLELAPRRSLPRARDSRASLAGLKEALHEAAEIASRIRSTATGSSRWRWSSVRRHLRESKAEHILVGAANDPSALGRRARLPGSGPAARCAPSSGQNAEPDARAEIAGARNAAHRLGRLFPREIRRRTAFAWRSTSWRASAVPPAVFVRHQIVTARQRRSPVSQRRANGRRAPTPVLVITVAENPAIPASMRGLAAASRSSRRPICLPRATWRC